MSRAASSATCSKQRYVLAIVLCIAATVVSRLLNYVFYDAVNESSSLKNGTGSVNATSQKDISTLRSTPYRTVQPTQDYESMILNLTNTTSPILNDTVESLSLKNVTESAQKNDSFGGKKYDIGRDGTSTKVLPLCGRDDMRQGKWVKVKLHAPPYIPDWYYKNKEDTLLCPQVHSYISNQSQPWISYDWQPLSDKCNVVRWNATSFCHLMQNKTLAVIGDSINQELRNSIFFMLGKQVRRDLLAESLMDVCGMQLYFRRDPLLSTFQKTLNRTSEIDVLVINRGAHYKSDSLLLPSFRLLLQELVDYQQFRWSQNKTFRVFWRTTPPGHPRCLNSTQPAESLQAIEAMVANKTSYDPNWFWWDFQRQNLRVLDELAASNLEYDILDGYDMMVMRPDLHKTRGSDCLHSCYPGKVDAYPPLLLQYLLQDPYKAASYSTLPTQTPPVDSNVTLRTHMGDEGKGGVVDLNALAGAPSTIKLIKSLTNRSTQSYQVSIRDLTRASVAGTDGTMPSFASIQELPELMSNVWNNISSKRRHEAPEMINQGHRQNVVTWLVGI